MDDEKLIKENLKLILEKHRGKLENIKIKNIENDEEFAQIGKAPKEQISQEALKEEKGSPKEEKQQTLTDVKES